MTAEEVLGRIAENLSVRRAFGTQYERDGLLVIPVALVAGGGGGGEGSGFPATSTKSDREQSDHGPETTKENAKESLASGSGGGFGGVVLPIGVYAIKGEEVRWISAINETLAIIASLIVVRRLIGRRARVRTRHERI